jgi:16S rRNA (adenine1518-N6/adenine1519-N6)-dimethyltransferase
MALTRSQTLAELTKLGHHPRKQLGQNYLIDGNIVAKSLRLAEVIAGEQVVEIGPGLGTLTRSLLEQRATVWAVEYDSRMAAYLRAEVLSHWPDRFHLKEGDAVKHPRAGLPEEIATAGFKVVANLPYAISTPWLSAILSPPWPERMVLMLQRETADRFRAQPGTKQFISISIILQSAYDVLPGHPVPAGCFHPPPEVDSYLLNLRLKESPVVFSNEARSFMRNCFQQRRKQIGSQLRHLPTSLTEAWLECLDAHGLDRQARPEQVTLSAWQDLGRLMPGTPV